MLRRLVRRSAVLAAAATLLFAGSTYADSVAADGDDLAGVQNFVDLEVVEPGATIELDIELVLFCGGIRHVDPGQIVTVTQVGETVPEAGGSISATGTTIGPVPAEWANDTLGASGCLGAMHVDGDEPSHVTIVAPLTPGLDYLFSLEYGRTLAPAGVSDASSINGFTLITFVLDVDEAENPDTTPPTLSGVPGDMDVLTSDPTGTTLEYVLPTAIDDRDPAPVVACNPAPGDVLPLGATTVTCTATDATGNQAREAFGVTVHLAAIEWGDPIGGGGAITATRGRSLPVKVRAWLNGAALSGPARLDVWSCGARALGPERTADPAWQSDAGRWMAVLDTSGLAAGCHTVVLVHDGSTLGSFTLQVVDPPTGGAARGQGSNRPT